MTSYLSKLSNNAFHLRKMLLIRREACDKRSMTSLESLIERITKTSANSASDSLAQRLVNTYYSSNGETKLALIRYIADRLSVDTNQAASAVNFFIAARESGDLADSVVAVDKLRASLTPLYATLFNRIAKLENGVKFIVDLRSDLLESISDHTISDKLTQVNLRSLSNQMKNMLSLWFSVGFLNLERITWDSPTSMLQKVSEYEAVHPMRNWVDLKRRVGRYRRCYVFTHSCLPNEPLVILHVALTDSIACSIQDIIKRTETTPSTEFNEPDEDPNQINCAIFYSISSTQKGLHGIELGNQLIKRVLREIRGEYPQITKFSSLSPIPNFSEYLLLDLQAILKGDRAKEATFATGPELALLRKYLCGGDSEQQIWPILMRLIRTNSWTGDHRLAELIRGPLMRKCAHYLVNEKRRGFALDSVAHFHLRNGAVMWRLNWLADTSARGLSHSCGIMANYRYFLDNADLNSRLYSEEKRVTADSQVLDLFKSALDSAL